MNVRIPMKARLTLASLAIVAASAAHANDAPTEPVEVGPKVHLDTRTGPVTVVSVQPPLPNYGEYQVTLAELDENNDGRLSKAEVPDTHALHFEFHIADRDGNGYITPDELESWKH